MGQEGPGLQGLVRCAVATPRPRTEQDTEQVTRWLLAASALGWV